MIRIVVQADVAEQIRNSEGPVELVDHEGNRVGTVRRRPTDEEIAFAQSRRVSEGPKFTIDQLIEKVESL